MTTGRTTSEAAAEEPTAALSTGSSTDASPKVRSKDPTLQPRKGIRLNRVLGRIVPIILLVYISYAYDLVVVRYAYRYLHHRQNRTFLPILWLLPTHGLFLWSLRSYLRVFFAHDHITASRTDHAGILAWLRIRLGATFPDPYKAQLEEQESMQKHRDTQIQLCQADGQTVRCYRDDCNGRVKAFRTRHCGDCGTCRVGFDHHCAWFDNDVTAPATLRSFIGFLVSIPPLYLLGLGPLFPSAGQTLKRINAIASSDPFIRSSWWSKWYSWAGGPVFRWMVGFSFGASRWSQATPDLLPHESPRAPILVALGAVFVFVATALASSSLTHLRHGKLTIDVERSKAFHKLQRSWEKLQKEPTAANSAKGLAIQRKMELLAPIQHFKVTSIDKISGEAREIIVALSVHEGLLSHGTPWLNIGRFLGFGKTSEPGRSAWSLTDSALQKVLEKAAAATAAAVATTPVTQ